MKKSKTFFAALVVVLILTLSLFWTAFHQNSLTAISAANHTSAELKPPGLRSGDSLAQPSSSEPGSDEEPPAVFPAGAESANALPTPVPGDTLVYFVPTDNDASGTVLYLYNTDSVTHTVPLRGFSYNGVLVYSLNITLKPTSFLRLASDSIVSAPPPSWATPAPIITNFTDFTYFASLSLPKGVTAEGYTLFNPGTGVVDPRHDQGAIPLSLAPATNSLSVQSAGNGHGDVTSSPVGIDCGADCQNIYFSGTQITLTATADVNSLFSAWSGACAGTAADCQVLLVQDDVVTATFALKTFMLAVSKTGNGSGSVTSSPAGIDCGATCTQTYEFGQQIALLAEPDANSEFTGWGGACSGTQNACNVTMTDAQAVTAEFVLKDFTLTAQTDGQGTVMSSPAGIDCGTECSHKFATGATVMLTASPSAGWIFDAWAGDCSGDNPVCTITMSGDKAVAAKFALQTLYLPEIRR